MTPIKSLAQACNLSLEEAAKYTGMPYSSTKEYFMGTRRNTPPEKALKKLHALSHKIDDIAERLAAGILSMAGESMPEKITLRIFTKDKNAETLGLPYASTHAAMLGRCLNLLPAAFIPLVAYRLGGPEVEDVDVT